MYFLYSSKGSNNGLTKVTQDRLNAIDSAIIWNDLYVWSNDLLSFKHVCYLAKVLTIPHLSLVSLVKILQIKPVLRSEKAVSTAKVKGNRHHFHSHGTKHPSAPAS